MNQFIDELQNAYDQVAEEYADRIFNELEHKPLDCELLNRFAESMRDAGLVCDMGCGPGQIARHLRGCGVKVIGVDLSAGMVEQARKLNPGIEFKQDNMLSLNIEDEAWAGIAAFYSIIHIPREKVVDALIELKRVLKPNGLLLLSFHIGDEIIRIDDWWGKKVSADFIFFQPSEMENYLKSAGFLIEEAIERAPYEGVEYQSRRAYIFARKP